MLVKNSFEYDARVRKEAESLVQAGHRVTVVAIYVPGVTAPAEILRSGVEVLRVSDAFARLRRFLRPATQVPGASTGRQGHRRAGPRLIATGARLAGPLARALNAAVLNARMIRAAGTVRPDVVHAHDLNTLWAALRCKSRWGARVIYDAHELHAHRNDWSPLRRRWAGLMERRLIRRVDAVITATQTWAGYLSEWYGISPPTVLRNVPELPATAEVKDLRAWLGIDDHQRILLYQGSIQRNRGIEEAMRALHLLDRCVLVVIGYGAHRPALDELAVRLGLAERVRFAGPVPNDELVAWSAGADVGLCVIGNSSLSYYTSLPNKLFEYMAAGIPVVASDFPEMGKVVTDYDVGELCDPHDPASIAAAASRIIDDPERAARCRDNARRASQCEHWGAEEVALLEVYDLLSAARRA